MNSEEDSSFSEDEYLQKAFPIEHQAIISDNESPTMLSAHQYLSQGKFIIYPFSEKAGKEYWKCGLQC